MLDALEHFGKYTAHAQSLSIMKLRDKISALLEKHANRLPIFLPGRGYKQNGMTFRRINQTVYDPGRVFVFDETGQHGIELSLLPFRHLLLLLAATAFRPVPKPIELYHYADLRNIVDGTPEEEIHDVFRRFGMKQLTTPATQDELEGHPRTHIEELTRRLPLGNTCSDTAFSVENKDYEFIIIIHYGLCYTSINYIDKTTEFLQKAIS